MLPAKGKWQSKWPGATIEAEAAAAVPSREPSFQFNSRAHDVDDASSFICNHNTTDSKSSPAIVPRGDSVREASAPETETAPKQTSEVLPKCSARVKALLGL